MTIVTGADLPRLGWQANATLDVEAFAPIGNRPWIKPRGGLWTAPLTFDEADNVTGSAWREWCVAEDFGDPAAPITEVLPDPSARVYMIDNLGDLVELHALCPRPESDQFSRFLAAPNWTAVAARFDALYLTERGQWATRFTEPSFNGWDCATVLWLQPRFTVGKVHDMPEGEPCEK